MKEAPLEDRGRPLFFKNNLKLSEKRMGTAPKIYSILPFLEDLSIKLLPGPAL